VELRWLTAFVTVAEELNYRRAAERLHVAQPAISQQIMNLEKDLGVKLFDRNNRSVQLTDAGDAFLAPCRFALSALENAGLSARNAGTGEYGKIRLGFNAGFTTDHLVSLVQVLRREHPNLELTIDTSRRTPDILKMLRDQELDVGLVGGPAKGSGLEKRRISATRLGVVLQEAHPLARAASVPVQALANEHLVLLESTPGWSIRRMVDDALERAGVTPDDVTTVADGMTMLAFVAAGVGIGFSSLNAAALTPRHLKMIPLAEGSDVTTSLVWKASNETPALRMVIAAVEQYLVVDAHSR
jgi:DNA-binding transcriptional LysR family regulator